MSQSQLTFEDLPTQTSESFHPSKQPKEYQGLSPRHYEQGGGTLTLQHEILSKQDPYNPQENTLSAPKQTGNTPRFGAGKKIGPLKPLNPRPNELIAVNSNDNSLSDSSPITKSKLANESHFRSQQEADYSPANRSLSPSNQGKFDINSVGNSPRKKANALKHPLINKKSPLFKKFGMENFSLGSGYQGTFQTAADNYEAYLLEKKSLKAPIDTEKMNIRNRANLTQMIEKHHEVKKVQTNATESTSYTANSSSNIISSEYPVHSEAGAVTKSNTKENHPTQQVNNRNLKVPKIPTKSSFKNGSTNSVAESNRIKSIGEAHSFCEGESQHEYRRKKYGHPKKTIPAKTSSGGNLKEGLHNDSITSLELSAIVNDINEKDPLNLSKDEILLQYIDEQDASLKLKKHVTSEMTNDHQNTEDNNNILRKSSSASNMENFVQQEQSPKPLIPLPEETNKQQTVNAKNSSHSRGRRMFVKSFISEEGGGGAYTENFETDSRIYANHDRNSSMYEISDQYKEYSVSQRKQVPEKFKQRRVESALPRGTNSCIMDNSPSTNMHWKEKATLQVKQQRLPNTEKNNVKHFHFLGSPNLGFLHNQENMKKRLYVNIKPGTSSGLNRSNLKKDRPSLPHRISNPKNKFAFQSVGPYYSNLNDSGLGLGFDDSIDAGCGSNSSKKSDLVSGNFGRFGDLSPILPDENNVLKLKEEIKKLQVKDQEAQVKIAKLHIQMETQNKEWEKKVESIDQIWKQRLNQQREYYEKMLGSGASLQKKI